MWQIAYLTTSSYSLQELKLHTFEASSLPELAYLLHKLAMALGLTGYCDHYQTDHPALLSRTTSERMSEQERGEGEGEGEGESDAVPQSPPHIFHWLQSSLRGEEVCGQDLCWTLVDGNLVPFFVGTSIPISECMFKDCDGCEGMLHKIGSTNFAECCCSTNGL